MTDTTLRLLYVEDHRPSVAVLEAVTALRPQWRMQHAGDVGTAIEMTAVDPPHLIVLDMNLPDGTGLDVLATVRADPATRDVPVVVLSAETTPGMSHRAVAAGANAYWTKPLDVHLFLDLLDRMAAPAQQQPAGPQKGLAP